MNMDNDHLYEPVSKRARFSTDDKSGGKLLSVKSCEFCGATTTPMWRRGPGGRGTLCNACGVRWSLKFRKGNKNTTTNKKDASPQRWSRREQSPPAEDFPGSTSSSADELSAPSSEDDNDDGPYESSQYHRDRRHQVHRVSSMPGTPGQWTTASTKRQLNFPEYPTTAAAAAPGAPLLGAYPRHRQLSRLDDSAVPISSPGPSFRRLLSVVEEAAHEQQVAQLKREIAELKAQTAQLCVSVQQQHQQEMFPGQQQQPTGLIEKAFKLQATVSKIEETANAF